MYFVRSAIYKDSWWHILVYSMYKIKNSLSLCNSINGISVMPIELKCYCTSTKFRVITEELFSKCLFHLKSASYWKVKFWGKNEGHTHGITASIGHKCRKYKIVWFVTPHLLGNGKALCSLLHQLKPLHEWTNVTNSWRHSTSCFR